MNSIILNVKYLQFVTQITVISVTNIWNSFVTSKQRLKYFFNSCHDGKVDASEFEVSGA